MDNLLLHLQETKSEVDENKLTMEQVLFELEDFIGGHSAVANLVARALVEIAAVDGMSEKIYNEVIANILSLNSVQSNKPRVIALSLPDSLNVFFDLLFSV